MSSTAPIPQLGHLATADKAKIANVPISEGNVIFSEGHAMMFIDYASKRHVSGAVISASFDGTTYKDFGSMTLSQVLTHIKSNTDFKDGQYVNVAGYNYQYRVIGNRVFLLNVGQQMESYMNGVHISGVASTGTVNCLIAWNGQIVYATLGTSGEFLTAKSIDGSVTTTSMNAAFTVNHITSDGHRIITMTATSNFRIISYSVDGITSDSDYIMETLSIAAMDTK